MKRKRSILRKSEKEKYQEFQHFAFEYYSEKNIGCGFFSGQTLRLNKTAYIVIYER